MNADMGQIDPARWALYFVFGVPFLAWLFFTRNNALRVTAVVAVLICIQNSLTSRRYLWAIGVGPSNITAYVALLGCFVSNRRMPPLGIAGGAWAALLFFGFGGLIIGSIGTNDLIWNVVNYQQNYLEQFAFFLLGVVAIRDDEELRKFLLFWVGIGFVVALAHYVTLATGFRFRDFAQANDPSKAMYYGGFFNNANTMGSFYCMCLPIALLLLVAGRLAPQVRAAVAIALVAMVGSLLLAVHRGGIITITLLAVGVLATSLRRPGRGLLIAVVGIGTVALSAWLVTSLLPAYSEASLELASGKGLDTPRFEFWPRMLWLMAEHPFGIGLTSENLQQYGGRYGFDVASTHNLYLAVGTAAGLPALIAFLVLVGSILLKAVRARRVSTDAMQRTLIVCLIVGVLGFLLVGFSESVWDNGYKVNNLFGLLSGVTLGTATRVLATARRQGQDVRLGAELEEVPAPGF